MILRAPSARALTLRHLRKDFFPWAVAFAVGIDYLDNSMFTFFTSYIAGGIDTPADELVWSAAAYATTSVLGIVQQQWLVERMGYRRYLSGCLLMFAIGSFMASTCNTSAELAVARGFQGYFIGPMLGTCRILLQICLPPAARAPAIRIFLLTILGATVLAPLTGGYLLASYDWRALFIGLAILGLAFSLFAFLVTPHVGKLHPRRRTRAQMWPYLVLAAGLCALQVVAQQVRFELFSTSLLLIGLTLLGLVALGWVIWHQWHHDKPLVRLNALRERSFRVGIVLYAFYYAISNAIGYLVARLLEGALGYPVENIGRLVGFTSMGSLAMAFIYFKFARKITRKKWLVVPGFLMAVAIGLWMDMLPPDVSTPWLLAPLIVRGFLLMFIALPTASVAYQVFAADEFNHGYRIKNIVKQLSYSFSTTMVIVLEQHRLALHQTRLAEYANLANPVFRDAFESMVRTFSSLGYEAGKAQVLAAAQVGRLVRQQAQFMSIQDGFRVIVVVALIGAAIAAMQRQIK